MIIEEGSSIRATSQITESGGEPDPNAEPYDDGWVHAEPGEEGVVIDIQQAVSLEEGVEEGNAALTVKFDRTGTTCTIFAPEVVPVKATENA